MTELTGSMTGSGIIDFGLGTQQWRTVLFQMTTRPLSVRLADAGTPNRFVDLGWVLPYDTKYDGTTGFPPFGITQELIWLNFDQLQWVFNPSSSFFQGFRFFISPGGVVAYDIKS